LASSPEQIFRDAVGKYQAGRTGKADRLLAKIDTPGRPIPDVLHLRALIALREDRPRDAIQFLERATTAAPEVIELHALLGAAFRSAGLPVRAEKALELALEMRPDDTDSLYNLANALRDLGRPAEAEERLRQALAIDPGMVDARYNLGQVLQELDRPEEAAEAFAAVLEVAPDDVPARNNLGVLQLQAGDVEAARESFHTALRTAPDHPGSHANLGAIHLQEGDAAAALEAFRRAAAGAPDEAAHHRDLGDALFQLNRPDEALAAYARAMELEPRNPVVRRNAAVALQHMNRHAEALTQLEKAAAMEPDNPKTMTLRGTVHLDQGDAETALTEFRAALAMDPENREATLHLAGACEKTNRLDEGQEAASRLLQDEPDSLPGRLIMARLDRRSGDLETAAAGLSELDLSPADDGRNETRAECRFELGQVHDRLDQADRAFEHFQEANRLQAASWIARTTDGDRFLDYIARHRDWLRGAPAAATPSPAAERPAPAFLVGFPRSGTTLMDQILEAHGGTAILEEKPTLAAVRAALGPDAADYPEKISTLTADEIKELRRTYFAEAARFVDAGPDTLIIDKLPLNLVELGLIHRLFPDAPIVLALRHPCDVCLSCFMQAFGINEGMVHFLDLAATVRLYGEVMELRRTYEAALALNIHRLRYEDLVENFDAEVSRLLEFLGLPWNDAVRDFAAHARDKKLIDTPSYSQVTEELYTRSKFRWHRYRRHLEPHLPELQPYIDEFGYES